MRHHPRPVTDEELAHAEAMLAAGASIREVERTLGRTRNALKRHLAGRGWTKQDGGVRRGYLIARREGR